MAKGKKRQRRESVSSVETVSSRHTPASPSAVRKSKKPRAVTVQEEEENEVIDVDGDDESEVRLLSSVSQCAHSNPSARQTRSRNTRGANDEGNCRRYISHFQSVCDTEGQRKGRAWAVVSVLSVCHMFSMAVTILTCSRAKLTEAQRKKNKTKGFFKGGNSTLRLHIKSNHWVEYEKKCRDNDIEIRERCIPNNVLEERKRREREEAGDDTLAGTLLAKDSGFAKVEGPREFAASNLLEHTAKLITCKDMVSGHLLLCGQRT